MAAIALGLDKDHQEYVTADDLGGDWVVVEFWKPVSGYLAHEPGASQRPERFVSARRERLHKPAQAELESLAATWVRDQTAA